MIINCITNPVDILSKVMFANLSVSLSRHGDDRTLILLSHISPRVLEHRLLTQGWSRTNFPIGDTQWVECPAENQQHQFNYFQRGNKHIACPTVDVFLDSTLMQVNRLTGKRFWDDYHYAWWAGLVLNRISMTDLWSLVHQSVYWLLEHVDSLYLCKICNRMQESNTACALCQSADHILLRR